MPDLLFLAVLLTPFVSTSAANGPEPDSNILPNGEEAGHSSLWIKIDDFESDDSLQQWQLRDTDNRTNPRIENPQITEIVYDDAANNHFLSKQPAAEGVLGNRKALSYLKLPKTVPVGQTFTFYARINVEYFPNNHVFGLSNLEPSDIDIHNYDALEPSLRVTDKRESNGTKNDGTLMVRRGNEYRKIVNRHQGRPANPLETGVWYEVWFVVNNEPAAHGGQTYDVYLRGGDEFPDQQQVFSNADFRMARELPLTYFLTNCNTGPAEAPYGNRALRYDDLFMAQGTVLTSPIR